MAYTPLPAKAAGDTITQPNWTNIKDNFDASGIAITAALGDIPAGTGVNALAVLTVGAAGTMLVPDAGEATGLRWQIQPAARVYSNIAFDPGVDAWTSIDFTHERWDSDGMWAIGTPSRLTVPVGGDGIMHFGGNVEFDSGGGVGQKQLGLRILMGGATVIAHRMAYENVSGLDVSINISCDYEVTAANFFELQVWTSVNVDVLAAGNYSPEFWATWLRPAP